MDMNKLIYFYVGLIVICFSSCGVKVKRMADDTTRQIKVDESFTAIESYGITDIEYVEDPNCYGNPQIELTGSEERLDKVEIYVKDGILIVTEKEEKINVSKFVETRLTVRYAGVNRFVTSGTGEIILYPLKSDNISLITNGTGEIEGKELICKTLECETNGTGDIEIQTARCDSAVLITAGTGDIEIKKISSDHIKATTLGTGDISISGQCKTTSFDISGTGDINSRNLKVLNK